MVWAALKYHGHWTWKEKLHSEISLEMIFFFKNSNIVSGLRAVECFSVFGSLGESSYIDIPALWARLQMDSVTMRLKVYDLFSPFLAQKQTALCRCVSRLIPTQSFSLTPSWDPRLSEAVPPEPARPDFHMFLSSSSQSPAGNVSQYLSERKKRHTCPCGATPPCQHLKASLEKCHGLELSIPGSQHFHITNAWHFKHFLVHTW